MPPKLFLIGILLSSFGAHSLPAQDTTQNSSCKTGNFSEWQPSAQAEIAQFLHALQSAVAADNKQAAAPLFNYPFNIYTPTGKFKVQSSTTFLLKYSQIFTKQLKDLLDAQRPECLSKIGEKGYIIADGEIWFDKFSNGRWQVFSINLIFNH